jgi:hypothetical protein
MLSAEAERDHRLEVELTDFDIVRDLELLL